MFDGVAISGPFNSEGTPLEIDLLHTRLELLTGSSSLSLHFGPEFSPEIPSSATWTVLLECPSPSADAFVVAPTSAWTEPEPDTFFPAGKASLPGAATQAPATATAETELGGRLGAGEGLGSRVAPEARTIQAFADGGTPQATAGDIISGKASLTREDIEDILTGGARHGYDKHASELRLGFTGRAWRIEGEDWLTLHRDILGNPDRIFGASPPQNR